MITDLPSEDCSDYNLNNLERMEWLVRRSSRYNFIQLDGKKPIEKNWAKYSHEKKLFDRNDFFKCNAGIVTGPSSGIIVLALSDNLQYNIESQRNKK